MTNPYPITGGMGFIDRTLPAARVAQGHAVLVLGSLFETVGDIRDERPLPLPSLEDACRGSRR